MSKKSREIEDIAAEAIKRFSERNDPIAITLVSKGLDTLTEFAASRKLHEELKTNMDNLIAIDRTIDLYYKFNYTFDFLWNLMWSKIAPKQYWRKHV